MLSRATSALFLCILIQNGKEKNPIVDPILRGARACCAPLWIRHCNENIMDLSLQEQLIFMDFLLEISDATLKFRLVVKSLFQMDWQ